MDKNKVQTIFRNVYWGVGGHGSFLRKFGSAIAAADPANYAILEEAALKFIEKYNLNRPPFTLEVYE